MNNKTFGLLFLIGAGMVTACGYHAPYQTSGPAMSKEGVEIAIAGQRCYVNRTGEQFPTVVDDDHTRVELNLRIANRSDHVAVLSLDAFQLKDNAVRASDVVSPMESGSVSLAPGESKSLSLAFSEEPASRPGLLSCHHVLALETQNAVSVDGRHVSMEALRFQPAR